MADPENSDQLKDSSEAPRPSRKWEEARGRLDGWLGTAARGALLVILILTVLGLAQVPSVLIAHRDRLRAEASAIEAMRIERQARTRRSKEAQDFAVNLQVLGLASRAPSQAGDLVGSLLDLVGHDVPAQARKGLLDILSRGADVASKIGSAAASIAKEVRTTATTTSASTPPIEITNNIRPTGCTCPTPRQVCGCPQLLKIGRCKLPNTP